MSVMKFFDQDDWLLLAVTAVIAAVGLIYGSWWTLVAFAPTWGIMTYTAFYRRRHYIEEIKRRLLGTSER